MACAGGRVKYVGRASGPKHSVQDPAKSIVCAAYEALSCHVEHRVDSVVNMVMNNTLRGVC